jgi:serine/threonine protein phosphatase PrpC
MTGFEFSALSERGLRTRNDDAYCAEKIGSHFVFALADGLAGHPYGDIASRTAIDALKKTVQDTKGSSREILETGIRKADEAVRALSLHSPSHVGLSTTLVACLMDDRNLCTVLDTGEGNCLVVTASTAGNIRDIVREGTPATSKSGLHEVPRTRSLTDMITHVLGSPRQFRESDLLEFVLGDEFLLLGSDGLTGSLPKEAIASIVRSNRTNPDAACEMLVQEAMKAGSESTITVILVHGKR